jgi:hypothetical protein
MGVFAASVAIRNSTMYAFKVQDMTTAARFGPEVAAPGPQDMDLAGVRASTRKLVALAQREGAAFVVFGHDAAQWRTPKKAPAYYS